MLEKGFSDGEINGSPSHPFDMSLCRMLSCQGTRRGMAGQPVALPAPGLGSGNCGRAARDSKVMPPLAPTQQSGCPLTAPARCGLVVVGLSIPSPVWSCIQSQCVRSALGCWGMSHIPQLGQLLLPRGTKAGAFKAPNISSSARPSCRRRGKCYTGSALAG